MHSPDPDGVPEVGDTLVERYRLVREVRHTEAGVLFDARDLTLDVHVAVELASSLVEPQARRKWTRDAMLAQRLAGEHVLRVLDVGILRSELPFVVRESALCTLAAELEARGAVPVPQAVAWTLEACEAIAEAHAMGMAHGDLRLDNMVLARSESGPTVKVAWTSAAKAERAATEDVARDIAGLGAMLHVLATGRMDREAEGATTLPGGIAHAVSCALAQLPSESFRNVSDFAQALAPFAPAGHRSAQTVALLLSRAGIVGGGIAALDTAALDVAPRSSRRPSVPSTAASPESSVDEIAFADDWFSKPSPVSRTAPVGYVASPPKRQLTFAAVSLLLLAGAVGGSWLLLQNGKLPHWTGTAPPEEVGNTEVTSAPTEPAVGKKEQPQPMADELAPRAIESLPNARPAAGASHAPRTWTPPAAVPAPTAKSELRYTDPTEAVPATKPGTPADDSTSAGAPEPGEATRVVPAESPPPEPPAPAPTDPSGPAN